jgi:hypothetical protein
MIFIALLSELIIVAEESPEHTTKKIFLTLYNPTHVQILE